MDEKDILLKQEISDLEIIGKEEWICLLSLNKDLNNQITYYSAIIDDNKISEIIKDYSWDIQLGYGKPGFMFSGNKSEYLGLGSDGIGFLVYYRTWSGKNDRIFEISQEFTLYYDLYLNGGNYILIHNDGEEEIIIKIIEDKVLFKLKYVKEFLAIKNKKLVIYFEFIRFVKNTNEKFFEKYISENNYIL